MNLPSKLMITLSIGLTSTALHARTPLPPEVVTDTATIGEGSHVVTVEQKDDCNINELNLAKLLQYDDNMGKTIRISIAGTVGSNLVRPAVCRAGTSTGKIVVQGPAKIEMMTTPVYEPMKVAKIETVVETESHRMRPVATVTLTPGTYLVGLETEGSCYDQEFNVKKSYEYDIHGDAKMQILSRGQRVVDNLMRPMACYLGAKDTGTAVIEVGPYTETVEADGLMIRSVEKVVRTKTPSKDKLITCQVPGLYDAGYYLQFKKSGKKIKSASVSKISILGGEQLETIQRCRNYGRWSFLAAKCTGRKAIAYLDKAEDTAWLYERGTRGFTELACRVQ